MADPAIKVLPTPFQAVLALLKSDTLRVVEQAITTALDRRLIEDFSTGSTSSTQADLSVSSMTVAETEALLVTHRESIIQFAVAYLRESTGENDDGEYPEGEEQDPSETVEYVGLGVGVGITYAIFYNFLANRTASEFRAYLKNRRVPHQAKFARDLRRVFDAVQKPAK